MIWLNPHEFRMNPIALSIKHPPETIVYLLGDQNTYSGPHNGGIWYEKRCWDY